MPYIRTAAGRLSLTAAMDPFSLKMVGWALAASLESNLVEHGSDDSAEPVTTLPQEAHP